MIFWSNERDLDLLGTRRKSHKPIQGPRGRKITVYPSILQCSHEYRIYTGLISLSFTFLGISYPSTVSLVKRARNMISPGNRDIFVRS